MCSTLEYFFVSFSSVGVAVSLVTCERILHLAVSTRYITVQQIYCVQLTRGRII